MPGSSDGHAYHANGFAVPHKAWAQVTLHSATGRGPEVVSVAYDRTQIGQMCVACVCSGGAIAVSAPRSLQISTACSSLPMTWCNATASASTRAWSVRKLKFAAISRSTVYSSNILLVFNCGYRLKATPRDRPPKLPAGAGHVQRLIVIA